MPYSVCWLCSFFCHSPQITSTKCCSSVLLITVLLWMGWIWPRVWMVAPMHASCFLNDFWMESSYFSVASCKFIPKRRWWSHSYLHNATAHISLEMWEICSKTPCWKHTSLLILNSIFTILSDFVSGFIMSCLRLWVSRVHHKPPNATRETPKMLLISF